MGRGVEQPVARHDAVFANAAGPAIPQDFTRFKVDEFGPPPAAEDITVGGFIVIASMMMPRIFRFDVHEHLTGRQIALRCKVGTPRRPSLRRKRLETADPKRSAGNEHVANLNQ